jgi:hypothetical protein
MAGCPRVPIANVERSVEGGGAAGAAASRRDLSHPWCTWPERTLKVAAAFVGAHGEGSR